MPIIELNRRDYKITGDYPDGKYIKILVPVDVVETNIIKIITEDFVTGLSQIEKSNLFDIQRTNQTVLVFVEMLKLKKSFMNNEEWFIAGINELVTLSIITQKQADSYLSFT